MIRHKIKSFSEYADALLFKNSITKEGIYQIRRKQKSYDVVRREQGISKWSDVKANKGASTQYTKKRKKNRNGSIQYGLHEEDKSV